MMRRADPTKMMPVELKLREAFVAVVDAGEHELLTEAMELLRQAQNKVSDWVDLDPVR